MYYKEACFPNVKVLEKPVLEPYTKSDGTVAYYPKLAVLQGQSAGMADCSRDVYDKVEIGKTYDFYFSLNTDYDKVFIQYKAAIPSKS